MKAGLRSVASAAAKRLSHGGGGGASSIASSSRLTTNPACSSCAATWRCQRGLSSTSAAQDARPPAVQPLSAAATAPPQGVAISSTQPTYLRIPDEAAPAGKGNKSLVVPPTPPKVFTVAPSRAPTHGVHVATLSLQAYGPSLASLDFFCNFARHAAFALDISASNVARLPTRTRLWTVPKSPFVHKKCQENFWRKTHKRAIKLYDANDETVNRWLQFLRIWAVPGVGMKAQLFRYHEIGVGTRMLREALQPYTSGAVTDKAETRSSSSTESAPVEPSAPSDTLASAASSVVNSEERLKALADEILKNDVFQEEEGVTEIAAAGDPEVPGSAANSSTSAEPAQNETPAKSGSSSAEQVAELNPSGNQAERDTGVAQHTGGATETRTAAEDSKAF
ncbi:hypothetical protein K437DRAFT_250888 [Tilletiaria anomala UBC 951]|uniref:Small ribosomal subunit protein uS10m n=1 Tax=Tilletiaria anomala (strain ATCC 24038 / CBS 436.72 / UBC 951) TaxID=1037660 RepID=A0A066VBM4_TILAU|nr:uncharacterized protein K437DRAFT_250888 [Tilletiaria anomala UBC 951]KDN39157.1 hypothetical protein K437DRAFT_250888 [Tilletiaria anomala UBC 951]